MKKVLLVLIVLQSAGLCISSAQEVATDRVKFHVNNLAQSPGKMSSDIYGPVFSIISPSGFKGKSLESAVQEVTLIGEVKDESNIEIVSVNSQTVPVNENGIFTLKLALTRGTNRIPLTAMDEHNNVEEDYVIITYEPSEINLADRIAEESKYYALIIGIDNYPDPAIPSLDNPVRDAHKLKDILISRYTFERDHVFTLDNAKRTDIIYALDNLGRVVTKNDHLLIFYAGHGYFDENANIGYWLPSDARKISKAEWFRNSTIADYLKEIESRHTLLITDACFGGSIFKMRAAFSDAPAEILDLYEAPSRKAMTSGNLTEVPDESQFTAYLIDRLENNQEKYLTSESLFSSFYVAVTNNSESEPQFGEIRNVGDEGGDFIFVLR